MVQTMMFAHNPPPGNSYTLGWDIVVSYSEDVINRLLAKRHDIDAGKMLKTIEIVYVEEDTDMDLKVQVKCTLRFGPPVLQFSETSSVTTCSLIMDLLEGTTHKKGDANPENIPEGFKLIISNIPLGTVHGKMNNGMVNAEASINPGDKVLHFDSGSDKEAHIVLDFPSIQQWNIRFDHPDPSRLATEPFASGKLSESLCKYIANPEIVSGLSYSIAAVNNSVPSTGATDLQPESVRFASFSNRQASNNSGQTGARTSLSIFIKTKGGKDTGDRDQLQSKWQDQWAARGIAPIPDNFTASVLFSAEYVYNILLVPGFGSGKWSVSQETASTGIKFKATLNDTWSVPYLNFPVDTPIMPMKIIIGEKTFSTAEFPLYVHFKQTHGGAAPKMYMSWRLKTQGDYMIDGDGLVKVRYGDGTVNYLWNLGQLDNPFEAQEIQTDLKCSDTEFTINVDMSKAQWQCGITSTNEMFWGASLGKGLEYVIQSVATMQAHSPTLTFPNIHFLRTTNLLTPDRECIDFNEEIGIQLPRDMLLVGDVLPV